MRPYQPRRNRPAGRGNGRPLGATGIAALAATSLVAGALILLLATQNVVAGIVVAAGYGLLVWFLLRTR